MHRPETAARPAPGTRAGEEAPQPSREALAVLFATVHGLTSTLSIEEVTQSTGVELGDGISGHVARTGVGLRIEDVERDPRFARLYAAKERGRNRVCSDG